MAECVEMRSSSESREFTLIIFVVMIIASMTVLSLTSEGASDPTIDKQLELEVLSGPEVNPIIVRCTIPWDDGEPMISGFYYGIGSEEWTYLENWPSYYTVGENRSFVTFTVGLDWGVQEMIIVLVKDHFGSNSTVATPFICSRKPTVEIEHLLEDGERPVAGNNRFRSVSDDPDGQKLLYSWFVDGIEVCSSKEMEAYLAPGGHIIEVEVSDGQWTASKEMNLTFDEPDEVMKRPKTDYLRISSITFLIICIVSAVVFVGSLLVSTLKDRSSRENPWGAVTDEPLRTNDRACEICMKTLRDEQSSVRCRCGAHFHRGCGRREGVCPNCGREILI